MLGVFGAWELRRPHPLLDPRLFRRMPFAAGSLSITLQFFGFISVVMQYLQLVRGDTALFRGARPRSGPVPRMRRGIATRHEKNAIIYPVGALSRSARRSGRYGLNGSTGVAH
ncbi:hypothetical protein ACFV06_01690 [Streptomyces sp. NPDC059618]|uniref:hypothetical protein n=1 Tax=Streptomyces sp. NPDC059618 TaxID=3346887 RepID=UPI00368D1ABA